ncbi:MAG: peptidase pyroglutamyl peptidase [Xanthobacteraceae bacterium]|jgi:pyroglutamyl-peptidase|nr:peptidase pyroglutamyl peptidase [Xanthobacteraceae bacterium]
MVRQTRVLITGFGRFPGAPSNPSGALAKALARRRRPALAGLALTAEVLPTTWEAAEGFAQALDREQPDIVLMIGLAGRRRQVCVETLAVNRAGGFPDALRRRPTSRRLDASGPDAIGARAQAVSLVRALQLTGVPARASRDAGRYICNALAYGAYRHSRATGRPRLAVFVHIPRPNRSRLALPALLRALEALLVALAGQFASATRNEHPSRPHGRA